MKIRKIGLRKIGLRKIGIGIAATTIPMAFAATALASTAGAQTVTPAGHAQTVNAQNRGQSTQVPGANYTIVNNTDTPLTIGSEINVVCFIECHRATDWQGPQEGHVLQPGQTDHFFVQLDAFQDNKLQVLYEAPGNDPDLVFTMYGSLSHGNLVLNSCPQNAQCDVKNDWEPVTLDITPKAPNPA